MQAALADALRQRSNLLLVDLVDGASAAFADSTCLAAGDTAFWQGTVYAISRASDLIDRFWAIGWHGGELPNRYPTMAAGILAMTHQPGLQDRVRDRGRDRPAGSRTAGSRAARPVRAVTARRAPPRPNSQVG